MTVSQQLLNLIKGIFQWWVTIAPWQQGIRVRFGKHVRLLESGIHFKLPIFDVVYMQAIRVRSQHIHNQTLTTKDGKAVSLAAAIQYEIVDLLTVYEKVHNAHDMIEQITQSAIAKNVYVRDLNKLSPEDLEKYVMADIDLSLYGIEVHNFTITSFAVVKTYRLLNGDLGSYTGYDQRFETELAMGEPRPN